MLGDAERVYLPDIGRARAGAGRFRGLRLIRTYLGDRTQLTHDDLTDLSKLQLDMVGTVEVRPGGYPGAVQWAHLLPDNPEGKTWEVQDATDPAAVDLDFAAFVRELEAEFQRKTKALVGTSGQPAMLVFVSTPGDRGADVEIAEMLELCRTAGVDVVETIVQRRHTLHPKFAVGPGKLEDIVLRALQLDVDLLIFGQDLDPGQMRSITNQTEIRLVDRTQLILDIFAQHATTADGKLQVELAQLKYNLPRLSGKNTGMSRLTGGIGGRGPGETKLEINRRRARDRVHKLEKDIQRLSKQRELRRSRRDSRGVRVAGIVGYTNAGKSTLLNNLTNADVLSEDLLFATLTPTSRQLYIEGGEEVVLTDTVGFIHDLPPDLVAAFKATLEELAEADILVHVVDAADPQYERRIEAVNNILSELELDDKDQLLVFNKADQLPDGVAESIARQWEGIAVSALDRSTLPIVVEQLRDMLFAQARRRANRPR